MNLAKMNVVLLVVAVALAVPTALQLRSDAETFVDLSRIPLLFDGFTADNVGAITIGTPKKEQPAPNPAAPNQKTPIAYDLVSLLRTEKGWMIGQSGPMVVDLAGAPANKDLIEANIFAHLRKIRCDREALVQASASPEQLKEFGLDEAQATVIKVSDRANQAIVAELLVGREAAGAQTGTEAVKGVFVRKSDSNDVVLYEYDKGWLRPVQTDAWLDKVLLKLEPDKVQRLSLRNTATAGKTFVFEKQGGKASWVCKDAPADRGAVRQAEVESFVQRLRYITVQDFRVPAGRAGNLTGLGLGPAQIELEIGYKDGDADKTAKFEVGNKLDGKNEYYLLSSEVAFLMTWPAALVTSFELNPAEAWFDPAAPKEAPKAPDAPKDDAPKDK
ncbi:MAG: DUF4340 domain-containing protein [Planctomycetes bacterium]|jgi:hypothetical protein|nr:DUF4340 domain-containing protein [Planctomycetota bacterium]